MPAVGVIPSPGIAGPVSSVNYAVALWSGTLGDTLQSQANLLVESGLVKVRQTGGVAGVDEVQISDDGTMGCVMAMNGILRLVGAASTDGFRIYRGGISGLTDDCNTLFSERVYSWIRANAGVIIGPLNNTGSNFEPPALFSQDEVRLNSECVIGFSGGGIFSTQTQCGFGRLDSTTVVVQDKAGSRRDMAMRHLECSGAEIDFTGLPTSDPAVAGRLWNDGGTVKVSAG